jgi:2-keto-4-pentenoate hydratase/2-oxohepta-3-ene-1,7-dioic acid hydratase in catechol pathway
MNQVLVEGQWVTPSKVVCIGRNYVNHIAELNNTMTDDMVVFMKPNASISSELYAFHSEPLHYEGEISFMVNDNRLAAVGFGLDLTKRRLQSDLKAKQLPWERAKSFSGAAVLSQFVCLDEQEDISTLSLELLINGECIQKGSVADMRYKPDEILADIQQFISLEDGDIIMTGTPEGVGEVIAGRVFSGRVFLGDKLLVDVSWTAK